MGIDIYMRWPGQSREEKNLQYTGFDIGSGRVGYLREAYHGGPYVTNFLLREAFEGEDEGVRIEDHPDSGLNGHVQIPASVLWERLPHAILLALYRERVVYHQGNDPKIVETDDLTGHMKKVFNDIQQMKTGSVERNLADNMTDEQIRAVTELIESNELPKHAQSFVDFVRLAEKMEQVTGEPVYIYASY